LRAAGARGSLCGLCGGVGGEWGGGEGCVAVGGGGERGGVGRAKWGDRPSTESRLPVGVPPKGRVQEKGP